jgi:two-component system phosphate regulon sensor histidine kinase PhoR
MNEPSATSRPASVADRAKLGRRARDFWAVGGAAIALLLVLATTGQANWVGVGLACLLIATFCVGWFFATVDPALAETVPEADAVAPDMRMAAEAERAFRVALIEALPEPAMFIDAQGKVGAANAGARKQFRFLAADPMLTTVVRRPELLDAVLAARRTQLPQRFDIVERDETDRYFSCVAAPMGSGVLVSLHDFTDIKRAEFARVDFLANASHELRTPLTSLSGFIETLRGPAREDPEAWDRFLEIMQGQADRMRRLISDLLSLSRIELVEHRPPEGEADLAAVVAEVSDALLPLATARGVKLRLLGLGGKVSVTGVHDELSQVAQNLVDNAIKYSETDGSVEIEVLCGLTREEASARAGRRWPEAGRMSIATGPERPGGAYAVLRVCDSGPGIERQYLPRLSERFYRVDPGRGLRPGTGLGLAIVKHVVQRHRGDLLVESEPGRGSAFGVVLPMTGEDAGGSGENAAAARLDVSVAE